MEVNADVDTFQYYVLITALDEFTSKMEREYERADSKHEKQLVDEKWSAAEWLIEEMILQGQSEGER